MLTEKELYREANKFLGDAFNMSLSVPLTINNRLSSTLGRFQSIGRDPISVELGGFFVKNNSKEAVIDVLKHELVHYALFMRKEPNSDGHPHFEDTLDRLGVVSQSNIARKLVDIKTKPSKVIFYRCEGCELEIRRRKRLPHNGKYHHCMSCGPTKGKLKQVK